MRRIAFCTLLSTLSLAGSAGLARAEARPQLPKLVDKAFDRYGVTKTYQMPSGRKVTTRREGGSDEIAVESGRYKVTNRAMHGGEMFGGMPRNALVRQVKDKRTGLLRDFSFPVPTKAKLLRREQLRDRFGRQRDTEEIVYRDATGHDHVLTRKIYDDQIERDSK